ncbi:MAG TPA: Crp/Fnr family transcriptional regulator [Pyrinomonadaceae bacterium]|jgi:CRP-like cAMP-binding protein
MVKKKESLNLKFPKGEHGNCRTLTEITVENLPADGSLGALLQFARRSFVWQPGDRADRIYFLKEGRVGITSVDRDGREAVLGMIVAGEPFGELCFCGGPTEVRSTTATAVTTSLIFEITIEDFIAYMQQSDEVLGKFLFTFCIRLSHSEKRIAILALRGVEERLGHTLLHLARTRGNPVNPENPNQVRIGITHEELSGLSALSRQRVTIMMNRFRRLGLVQYSRREPLVVNINALAEHLYESA